MANILSHRISRFCFLVVLGACCAWSARAALDPQAADWERQFHRAGAAFRGTVLHSASFADAAGRLFTRHVVQVDEALKGRLPSLVQVTLPGGELNGLGEHQGCAPHVRVGDSHVFLLTRGQGGAWVPLLSCASVRRLGRNPATDRTLLAQSRWLALTDFQWGVDAGGDPEPIVTPLDIRVMEAGLSSSATNLLTDTNNIPTRFDTADRGEAIPYLVDATYLPSGINVTQALTAVSNALNAWAAAAFVTFKFEGLTNFGAPASAVNLNDGRIRIQLHDAYNVITNAGTLGIGGRAYNSTTAGPADWTSGGRVSGSDFHQTVRAYVVLEHGASALQTLTTFEEVLCHELGHALGLAHPSEDPNEPWDSPLRQAIMYYLAKQDGQGALLRTVDRNSVLQSYPTNNSPPFCFDRMMDIVIASPQPSGNGINEVELRGYDLQQTSLTLRRATNTAVNGAFSLSGQNLRYTANGFFPDVEREDPASGYAYDREYYRFWDGTHYSGYHEIRVLGYQRDTLPVGASDGIPDSAMLEYFGNENPAVGANHGANQDWDGDTLTNLQEYRAGMNLTNALSAQRATMLPGGTLQWQARAYEVYEILGSTNLSSWSLIKPAAPTSDTASVTLPAGSTSSRFYRIRKVP